MTTFRTARAVLALVAALGLATAGCDRLESYDNSGITPPSDKGAASELRLGYLPNVTHAAALIGVQQGIFAAELGIDTKLTAQTFNDGTEAVAALLGGSLDLAFVGPGPAINAFAKSGGEAVRVVAGATSGGAQLVAREGVDSAERLRGKKVATPKLGNTQDIALKTWLDEQRIPVGEGTDQVTVVNADNPRTFDAFRGGDLDAAWLPEPWASRLVLDAGAEVLVDEEELWPGGRFPTTVVLARTEFLRDHPDTVRRFLLAELAAVDWAGSNRAQLSSVVNAALEQHTGKALSEPVLERALDNITLTVDPLAATFPQLARDSVTAQVATSAPDLAGLVDLDLLNQILTGDGKPAVDAAGLDTE